VIEAGSRKLIEELRRRHVETIPVPFDGPVSLGGGLRSAHQALLRDG
jgi:hypothetical protein